MAEELLSAVQCRSMIVKKFSPESLKQNEREFVRYLLQTAENMHVCLLFGSNLWQFFQLTALNRSILSKILFTFLSGPTSWSAATSASLRSK